MFTEFVHKLVTITWTDDYPPSQVNWISTSISMHAMLINITPMLSCLKCGIRRPRWFVRNSRQVAQLDTIWYHRIDKFVFCMARARQYFLCWSQFFPYNYYSLKTFHDPELTSIPTNQLWICLNLISIKILATSCMLLLVMKILIFPLLYGHVLHLG